MSTIAARRIGKRVALLLPTIPAEDMPALYGMGHNGGLALTPALIAPKPLRPADVAAIVAGCRAPNR